MQERRTRWYQSLTLRLLALFWLLLLLALAAAFALAIYLTRPAQPEVLAGDFERTITPLFAQASSAELLQPGRLIVGEYRILARRGVSREYQAGENAADDPQSAAASVVSTGDSGVELMPGLQQTTVAAILRLLNQEAPMQLPISSHMLAGPFYINDVAMVVSRPLNTIELDRLDNRDDSTWVPNMIWLAVAISGFGAMILGFWFVRPLKQLRSATREIAAGVAEPNLARLPDRRDELGELARTLGNTAVELATSRDAQRRLLGDVSHELRSPLARLQVALDLLENDALKGNSHWRQLEKDIFRLAGIIDSILWLSRLENGITELVREPVSLNALLEDLRSDLVYEQQHVGSRLRVPDMELPTLSTDSVLLRLVIENLVRNSFQYGPDDGTVWIEAVLTEQHCCLTVTDEGPGVDEDKVNQLFVPFFRADPSRHHGAGVGLGLALCQRACAVLGGSIAARNHPDGGLEVSVCLPLDGHFD